MSAAIVLLALSAGYLINRKLIVARSIDNAMREYHKDDIPDDSGVTTAEMRHIKRSVDEGTVYQDMNAHAPAAHRQELRANQDEATADVKRTEMAAAGITKLPEIEGVMLHFGLGRES